MEKVPVEYTNGFYCTIEDMTSPMYVVSHDSRLTPELIIRHDIARGPTVPLFCAFVLMVIIGVESKPLYLL